MNEVIRALKPVKRRIRRNRFLRGAAAGLAAGLGTAALLQALSYLLPVPDRGWLAAAAAGSVLLLWAAVSALRPVNNRTAAEAADACGLQERAITALEGGGEDIHRLQQQDACCALSELDVRQIRPGSIRKQLLAALAFGLITAALLLIPSPRDSEAEADKVLRKALAAGRETISRAAEEDEAGLTGEQRNELRKLTAELNRELDRSRDAADALVALDRAEQRLEQMRQQTAGEAADAAAAGTAEHTNRESGQGTGAEGSGEAPKTERNGQASDGKQTASASGQSGPVKTLQAVSALQTAVNPSARSGMNRQGTQSGQAGQNALNMQETTGMQGQNLSGNAQGMNGGTGTNGNKAGGGAGEGSTNLEQGAGGERSGSGTTTGSRPPRYKEEKYETIYDPERTDSALRDEITNQERLEDEGSVQTETGPGRGNVSGDVPWSEVLHEYADTEARSAERENLTQRERQWVTEYFQLLTEQQD